jgi:hypothetical protein
VIRGRKWYDMARLMVRANACVTEEDVVLENRREK